MSSAMYPQGIKTQNNYTNQGGYKTWKGDGLFRIPTALTAGNVRPQINKDYTNLDTYKQGSSRPIRHYRRGFRDTSSSTSGVSMLSQIQDTPGQYVMQDKSNIPCTGIQFLSSYTPQTDLTNNPTPNTVTAEQKALRMVRSASTNINKDYYTTHAQYMQNRCQTYEQKIFNFAEQQGAKPGSPESLSYTYYAQCYPNDDRACKKVIYKPNNYKYATQGGVSSSARTYRLAVDMAKRR